MAKTTTRKIADAEKILHQLEAKAKELAEACKNDDAAMAELAYAGFTGDQKSQARLETIRGRAIKRDIEARNLDSAIAEAKRRVAAAQDAERKAEERKTAEEIVALAQVMRESGAKADKGLRMMVEGSNELREIIAAMQQLGLNNPSAQQLQSLGRRAILGELVDSPFARDFEHIAPRERQSFASFTASWAAAIERNVGAKIKKEEVA